MAEKIEALIAETMKNLEYHRERRDRDGMSQRDREAEGIECLACRIRLKALQQCLAIVKAGAA